MKKILIGAFILIVSVVGVPFLKAQAKPSLPSCDSKKYQDNVVTMFQRTEAFKNLDYMDTETFIYDTRKNADDKDKSLVQCHSRIDVKASDRHIYHFEIYWLMSYEQNKTKVGMEIQAGQYLGDSNW